MLAAACRGQYEQGPEVASQSAVVPAGEHDASAAISEALQIYAAGAYAVQCAQLLDRTASFHEMRFVEVVNQDRCTFPTESGGNLERRASLVIPSRYRWIPLRGGTWKRDHQRC